VSSTVKPLEPSALYTACPKALLDFKTTKDLKPLDSVIGQARAVESIRFAIGMPHDGYNLFAFGPEGTGKASDRAALFGTRSQGRSVAVRLVLRP